MTEALYWASGLLEIGGVALIVVDVWLDRRRARRLLGPALITAGIVLGTWANLRAL